MNIQTLQIVSFNGHTLNDSTYKTRILIDVSPQSDVDIDAVDRSDNFPIMGGVNLNARMLPIRIEKLNGTAIGSIIEWFKAHDKNQYQLIAQDTTDSSQWYVMAKVKGTPRLRHKVLDVLFFIDDPIWKKVTTSTDAWSITASGQTRNITVGGNEFARPTYKLKPTSARTGGYGYRRFVALCNRTTKQYADAINLADSDWNTSTLVGGGKMQSDGDDLRIIDDISGQEVFRWFGGGGINTSTTRPFVNVSMPPMISLTLNGSIAGTGAVATITVKNTAANIAALKDLALQAYKVLVIDMGGGTQEIFTFTAINVNGLQITGTTRAMKLSGMQAHSDGATIRHVSAGYWVLYGNATTAGPSTDDGFKPMFDIANSTNASHAYTDYYDPVNPARLGQFIPQILENVGNASEIYSANHYTFATSVASEMGMAIKTYSLAGSLRAPSATLGWLFSHPAGITTVSASGEKYRDSATFPATAALMVMQQVAVTIVNKKKRSTVWVDSLVAKWNETSPASVQTWTAFTQNSISLGGTYPSFGFYFKGTIGASDNYAALEIDAVTVALDSTYIPLIWFGSENNNNFVDARITNNTTAEWLEVHAPCAVNDTIVIDTDALECYLLSDATSSVPVLLSNESRAEWLKLDPTLNSGVNQLQYDETGANAVTLTTEWKSRNL